MSRSSTSRERRRGQAQPTVALAAVLALSLGLSAYAVVLGGVPDGSDRPRAAATLDRVHDRVTVAGVVSPDRLLALDAAALRDAARANVTVSAGGDRWTVGPPRPSAPGTSDRSLSGVARSERRVGVALGPGRVRPGRLAVTVWG